MTHDAKRSALAYAPKPGKMTLLWVGPILKHAAEHVGTPGETIPRYEMTLQHREVVTEEREEMMRRIAREAYPVPVRWCHKMMSQVAHAATAVRVEQFIDDFLSKIDVDSAE